MDRDAKSYTDLTVWIYVWVELCETCGGRNAFAGDAREPLYNVLHNNLGIWASSQTQAPLHLSMDHIDRMYRIIMYCMYT